MKIKTFIITFAGALLIVAAAAYIVVSETRAIGDINLASLENSLYEENIAVMTWFMDSAGITEDMALPESWGEIMLVDNTSLSISKSSDPASRDTLLYQHEKLLDQADGIIQAIKSGQEAKATTKDYMVAIKPVSGGQSLIGLKPRSWEKNILAAQNDKIADISSAAGNFTMMFIGAGILLSLVIALMIAMITAGTSKKTLDLFDRLSLGDFDTDVPKLPERDKHIYIRLKTSLMMALERLGEK